MLNGCEDLLGCDGARVVEISAIDEAYTPVLLRDVDPTGGAHVGEAGAQMHGGAEWQSIRKDIADVQGIGERTSYWREGTVRLFSQLGERMHQRPLTGFD